ncbi:MAG: molybdate ABC transporter permease subunit [Phycisphaerae bacterium]|nr:molybdate ABC transporter permease subunit [Phycisphaerae bacterium]
MIADTEAWAAVIISLRVALVSVLVMLIPGIAMAWWLARARSGFSAVVEALVNLPLVLPPVVVGYLLLRMLGRGGWIGGPLHEHLGIDVAFTWWAAAVASAVMGFPLLVRSTRLAIELVDRDLERAAANVGAGPWSTFHRITLPLALPGVLAGSILAFARSLGEFGATILVAGNLPGSTRTLALAIWTETQDPAGEDRVMILVLFSVVLSVVAMILAELLGRRLERRLGRRR